MNTIYLIGNGFDLNLGLKTSYSKFYEWYINSYDDRKDNVVSFINWVEKEKCNNDLWSCMEMALGEYTSQLKGNNIVEDCIDLHDNIVDGLSKYISLEENKFDYKDTPFTQFNNYLSNPFHYAGLRPDDLTVIETFKSKFYNRSAWNTNIISFNYSVALEKIIGYKPDMLLGNISSNKIPNKLKSIEHIHGHTDDRLLVGVNDISQVANKDLHNTIAIDYLVKPSANITCGEGHNTRCLNLISNADLIVIYGCSYGASDLQWWDCIIRHLKAKDIRLLLFNYEKDKDFGGNKRIRKQHYLDTIKDKFLSMSVDKLSNDEIKKIKSKIFVGHNSDMFKLYDMS